MRRAPATLLTLLAASWASAASAQVPFREIRLTLEPVTYSGPCPARLRAHLVFVSNFPTRVDQDDWGWNFTRTAPHSWDVDGGHIRTSGLETAVDTTLTLPRPGDTAGSLHEGTVRVAMADNPTISNTVRYSVTCTPTVKLDPNLVQPVRPGPTIALQTVPMLPPPSSGKAGPAIHLPDLVVSRLDPAAGVVVVTNTGDGSAAPSQLLLRILCVRGDGVAERCSVGAVVTTAPLSAPTDPSLGGLILPVPALAAGASNTITVGGWSGLSWRPGKYELEATADVRGTVAERSETNNVARARFAKP